ncbi:hypothetical protein ACFW04_001337 [Cataglyphis niger]
MRHVDVTPAITDKLLNTIYNNVKIAVPAKFKPNDLVRVNKFKTISSRKVFTPNWTTEIFRITKVQRTNPVTYLLKDSRNEPIAGGFYRSCFASPTPTYISWKRCCVEGATRFM